MQDTQSEGPMADVTVKVSTEDHCELCEFVHNDQSTEAKHCASAATKKIRGGNEVQ